MNIFSMFGPKSFLSPTGFEDHYIENISDLILDKVKEFSEIPVKKIIPIVERLDEHMARNEGVVCLFSHFSWAKDQDNLWAFVEAKLTSEEEYNPYILSFRTEFDLDQLE